MVASLSLSLKSDDDDEEGAVFEVINPYIQPNSTVSAAEVASELQDLAKASEENGSLDFFLQDFWTDLFHIAAQIPSDHPAQDKLKDLVVVLMELNKVKTDMRAEIWKTLPYGEWELRRIDDMYTPGEYSYKPNKEREWINWNAFKARLWPLGLRDHWIVRFKTGLIDLERPSPKPWWILSSAEWVKQIGSLILDHCELNSAPEKFGELSLAGSESLYQGPEGWSRQRWSFWKQRLEDLCDKYDEDVKKAALQAVHSMDLVEKEEKKEKEPKYLQVTEDDVDQDAAEKETPVQEA